MPGRRSHKRSSFRSIIRRIHLKKNQYHLSTDTKEEYHGGLAEPFYLSLAECTKRRDGVRSFGIGDKDFGPPSASSGVYKVSHKIVAYCINLLSMSNSPGRQRSSPFSNILPRHCPLRDPSIHMVRGVGYPLCSITYD